jgi:hypothetical protein
MATVTTTSARARRTGYKGIPMEGPRFCCSDMGGQGRGVVH